MDEEPNKGKAGAPGSEHTSSVHDWNTDFEDFTYPTDPNLQVPEVPEEQVASLDDICPQEPLDMDYLRQLSKESSDEEADASLSGSSKKIGKNKGSAKGSKTKKKEDGSEGKNRNKRKPWQPHEDAKVLEYVTKYGQSWALISSMMDGRTGKQIRDRYLNKLRQGIKKGDWTVAEDQTLLNVYYQIGHKWSKIATYLPGRTEGQVKNRFYSHIKKKILKDDGSPEQQETQTSPIVKQDSPDGTKKGPFTLNQATFGGTEPMTSPSSYSTQPSNQYRQLQDANDFISYNSGNSNGSQYVHNTGYQNQAQYNGHHNENQGTSDAFITYSNQPISTEKDFDDVLFKATNFYEHTSDNHSQTSEGENLNNMEKLERIELLNKRKKNLEYLLQRTMQDIQTSNPIHQQN